MKKLIALAAMVSMMFASYYNDKALKEVESAPPQGETAQIEISDEQSADEILIDEQGLDPERQGNSNSDTTTNAPNQPVNNNTPTTTPAAQITPTTPTTPATPPPPDPEKPVQPPIQPPAPSRLAFDSGTVIASASSQISGFMTRDNGPATGTGWFTFSLSVNSSMDKMIADLVAVMRQENTLYGNVWFDLAYLGESGGYHTFKCYRA